MIDLRTHNSRNRFAVEKLCSQLCSHLLHIVCVDLLHCSQIVTICGSDDSIVFSTAVQFFVSLFFSVDTITREPLHLAWWQFAWTCVLTTARNLMNFKVESQVHRSGFSGTLPLRDSTMPYHSGLSRLIAIGWRWRNCYKYHRMPQRLLWTDLALHKALIVSLNVFLWMYVQWTAGSHPSGELLVRPKEKTRAFGCSQQKLVMSAAENLFILFIFISYDVSCSISQEFIKNKLTH